MKQKKKAAVVHCGSCPEGEGLCSFGCTACGACRDVCGWEAVRLPEKGPAVIDRDRCTGCGKCGEVCQRHIISLVPAENTIQVLCASRAPSKETRQQCGTGCVGCGTCERNCPAGAMQVTENCAVIDQEICIACGMCAVRCPRNTIRDAEGILTGVPA